MGGRRRLALFGFILGLVVLMGLTAVGRVDLYKGNSGEAAWWFSHEHLGANGLTTLCASNSTDYCTVADHWNVELATYFSEDDWAYMTLDTGNDRLQLGLITAAGFTYKTTGVQTESGPHMGFSLVAPSGQTYLALSYGAAPQTASCIAFDATAVNWVWGTWEENGLGVLDPTTFEQAGTGAWAALLLAYGTYDVDAALVLMGVTGTDIGSTSTEDIETGQALIDEVVLEWLDGVQYGGTYLLEEEWPNPFHFDDSTQIPGHKPEERPLQYERWCRCNHCLKVDDSNLWGLVAESDLGSPPSGVKPFASSPYALYFGDPVAGNYNTGDVAVGVICSTFNELNPGDEYVSLSFDYFRQVEQYVGPFDWTYVQIKFYDGDGDEAWSSLPAGWHDPFDYVNNHKNPGDIHPEGNAGDPAVDPDCKPIPGSFFDDWGWKTVWYRDATDPNEGEWTHAVVTHYLDKDNNAYSDEMYRIKIPPAATRMKIRFGFNSVDGSNNSSFGWIVDNIRKTHSPEPAGCQIITATLPQAEVGVKYDFLLNPNHQTSPKTVRQYVLVDVTKDGVSAGPVLPRRLALDSIGRIYGEPDPGTSGSYQVTLRLFCVDGGSDTKTLILNIRAPGAQEPTDSLLGGPKLPENFDSETSSLWKVDNQTFGTTAGCPNLWHETAFVKYALATAALQAEYGDVAYFGQDDHGVPTDDYDPNYNCSRAKGCLMSPPYQVLKRHHNEALVIGFKSWRNVEYFTGGDFDATYVEVRMEGQSSWQEVWRKTSKDVSIAGWEWVEIQTGILLKEGTKVSVRFCFDSVDAYGNRKAGEAYGWLIDEVSLYAGSAEMAIVNCPREETSVGDYYSELIRVSGGATGDRLIWEISEGSLPTGLALIPGEDTREARIQGIPREPNRGTEFTIRARTADWSQVAVKTCTIVVTTEVALLVEDFEADPAWSLSGLWHFTNDNGVTGVPGLGGANHAAYYGQGDNTAKPNYDTRAVTSGYLTLVDARPDLPGNQPIDLVGVTAFTIEFDYWRWVESVGGAFDKTEVQVKLGAGDWQTVWKLDSSTPSATTNPNVLPWPKVKLGPYSTAGATTMLIRFMFNSVDKWYNGYTGWLIDNIVVKSAASGTPIPPMSADRLLGRDEQQTIEVMNIPNPVKDVHTTTFTVRNLDVEAMRIEIYDLAGARVYEQEIAGNELVWHTENDYGEFLANGIYIYRAYVLIDGAWMATNFQKLVILR